MSCDIDYRYRRALQPDGLTTYVHALRALNEAIDDVKLAGRDIATCPAVLLLTRHLFRIAEGAEQLGRVDKRDSQGPRLLIQDCFLRSSHGPRGFVECGVGVDRAAVAS